MSVTPPQDFRNQGPVLPDAAVALVVPLDPPAPPVPPEPVEPELPTPEVPAPELPEPEVPVPAEQAGVAAQSLQIQPSSRMSQIPSSTQPAGSLHTAVTSHPAHEQGSPGMHVPGL
jgi:hypothetical protein